ncbi:MAG: pyruvate formate lyase-activating protein [Chloroflexi bacterium]|nr:pyruvate formate lyase-activating protein [Chloroflexota bacterium]
MQILAVDIGTGTQDVFLFDPALDIENGYKLVMPSPTMIVHRRIKEATRRGDDVLLTGFMMGGGPSQWAARDHVRAGHNLYATISAARTFNDDLEYVRREMGIEIVSEDEASTQPVAVHIELKDFDLASLVAAFAPFGVRLNPDAIGVAVFDHGDAPPGYSDRQFRFDYLDRRIRELNRLSAFAYPAQHIPPIMTRLQSVASSYGGPAPLVVMDTAPAAVLGAMFDPAAASRPRAIFCNVGNFHVLAFRMGPRGVEGVFEHHTGEVDLPKLDSLISRLADGALRHADVFDDMGHGALMYSADPLPAPPLIVTGPRRSLMRSSIHKPYFAVPFGDMMIAGCFGVLSAMADVLPSAEIGLAIRQSLNGKAGKPPWENDEG